MINNNLKYCREELELTQKKLGNILAVSITTISKWELGYDPITLKRLVKFCNLYNYSLDYVCGLSKNNKKYNKKIYLNSKTIGLKLKKIRNFLKLSQDKFADKCSMAQSTYSHYENGINLITSLNLYIISKTYNVSMDWIIDRK